MFLSPYHHEILGVTTNDRSDTRAEGLGYKSKVKLTDVKTNFATFGAFSDRNSSLI